MWEKKLDGWIKVKKNHKDTHILPFTNTLQMSTHISILAVPLKVKQ